MSLKENPKKIALVGTSCVGKSTIFDTYQKQYHTNTSIAFVPEAARIFFTKNKLPEEQRFTVETQGKIQRLALQQEKKAHQSGVKTILAERSVLDAVVYTHAMGDKRGADKLFKRVADWLPTYGIIFLLDPEGVPYQKDVIRQEEPETREKFHNAFLSVFAERGVVYTLLSGDLHQRLKRVGDELGVV